VSLLLAHHDRPPFLGRPSLTGHCGHGWTCSLPAQSRLTHLGSGGEEIPPGSRFLSLPKDLVLVIELHRPGDMVRRLVGAVWHSDDERDTCMWVGLGSPGASRPTARRGAVMMRLQSGCRQLPLCEDACSIGSTTGASATKWPESHGGETAMVRSTRSPNGAGGYRAASGAYFLSRTGAGSGPLSSRPGAPRDQPIVAGPSRRRRCNRRKQADPSGCYARRPAAVDGVSLPIIPLLGSKIGFQVDGLFGSIGLMAIHSWSVSS
jgi:hypothetical protein